MSGKRAAADPAIQKAVPFEPEFGQVGDGPDELRASGEISGESSPQGASLELMVLMRTLKARREAMGLSLTDASERSGLTRQVISLLENGRTGNPTLATLYKYALALGANVTLGVEDLERE